MRPSFKQCMSEALKPVVKKHIGEPIRRHTTRGEFGDAQLGPQRAFGRMFIRMILVSPVGVVATVLFLSVVGIPLAIPLFAWIGSWCSKPLVKHPMFDPNADLGPRRKDNIVDDYERAYDVYDYGYHGREWK